MDVRSAEVCASSSKTSAQQVWLLGQPPLHDYLDFVDDFVIGGEEISRSLLVDEWRRANDYYGELEEIEAHIAEDIEIYALDDSLQPLVGEVRADPRYAQTFDKLPTRFAMVEIDLLLVGHPYLNKTHADNQASRLGPSPKSDELFRFCQPLGREEAPVHVRRTGARRYQFWSPSTDFRFQRHAQLRADQIRNFETIGPIGGVVAMFVGYGSNFLSLIEADNRLLIHNGHHRAYALRAQGITHAPAIIQTVTRMDELKIAATRTVLDDPAFYFRAKRPPLLKDFFDQKIKKVLDVPAIMNAVEVSFEIKEFRFKDSAGGG